ncbi:MAG TPA: polysaccharide biosynthesis tyrosine autokinase [Cyclobacteriaceae bacterium]|nr:polysaccharide biosynthesis tyrosine autokinase [Cyclobacteriaceae bacterium]
MEELNHNNPDNIDFNKLKIIIKNNLVWIVLIFILTNAAAFLYVRYTKEMYESVSEIKLDVKQDATELGIREFAQNQNLDLISGEIETIQSKLFLNNVIDSLDLFVQYFSIGQLLNYELYKSSPFTVKFARLDHTFDNIPFYIEEINGTQFQLRVGEGGQVVTGTFSEPLSIGSSELILSIKQGQEFQKGINYSFIYSSREALLSYLLSNLTVEPLNFNAKTIKVSFKDNNPRKARDLVNGIDSLYLAFSNQQKNQANKQKIEWLTNELHQIEIKMGEYEDYFENFTLKNKTSDLKEDLKKTISQINKIDSQRFELSKRIKEINLIMDEIASGAFFKSSVQQNIFPPRLNKNIEQLQDLYLEMDKMKLSYNENTFAYKQKEKEIQTVQSTVHTALNDLKTSWLGKLQELNNARNSLERTFVNMPDKNTQFNKNERFYKLYEELYLTLNQHKSEFEIAQAGSVPDFKLLSTATLPQNPIAPNKPIIYGIGMVSGLVIIVFLIGVLYLLNNKVTNAFEVERLATPMLGIIPAFRRKNSSTLHVLEHPKSMVSEAIRTLRTNLDFFQVNSQKKVIAISSTVSGEGKSFIAMNLGGVMALSKKKVVLIDLDMRKAKPHSPLQQDDLTKGMSTILIKKNSWQECLLKTPLDNFDVIPSGPQPPNPSELLLNGEFTSMLDELKEHYDYILMDTPPVGLVTDGIMAMKRADISIYVFRANYSKKDFLHSMQRITKVNKFNHVTTVLNALPATQETYYGAGYYDEPVNKPFLKSIFKRA